MRTEYKYKDATGDVIGVITRIDNKDGTRRFAPVATSPTLGRFMALIFLLLGLARLSWWWRARRRLMLRPRSCRTLW